MTENLIIGIIQENISSKRRLSSLENRNSSHTKANIKVSAVSTIQLFFIVRNTRTKVHGLN